MYWNVSYTGIPKYILIISHTGSPNTYFAIVTQKAQNTYFARVTSLKGFWTEEFFRTFNY